MPKAIPARSFVVLVTLASFSNLFASPTFAKDRTVFSIEARQWNANPSGRFEQAGGGPNETLDFERDLALQEDEALEGRMIFRPSRRTMIRIGYLPELQLAGDNVVTRSIDFLGRTFTINQQVVTDFTVEDARLGFAWQFLSASEGRFRMGPILETRGFRGDLALEAPNSPIPLSVTERYEAAFGSVGLIAELELSDRIELFGEATEAVTGDEGDVTESQFGIRVRVLPSLMVVGGSRNLDVLIEDASESFAFELDGVFFGLHATF